jgi:hypothetical protein
MSNIVTEPSQLAKVIGKGSELWAFPTESEVVSQ